MIASAARGASIVLALSVAFLAADPPSARADDDLSISATNKLDYRRLDQDNQREEALRNRLEVSAYRGVFGAWIRLQSLGVSDANVYDPYGEADDSVLGVQRLDATEVTRRLFTVDTERFRLAAGDFSWVFGRGLALSAFEDEELNFDSRLEGVRGTWESDHAAVTALGGTRDGNRFRGLFLEPNDFGPFRLGGSFVEAWGAEEDTAIRSREQHLGGLAEVNLGPTSFYAEFVRRDFPGRAGLGYERKAGHGAFASGLVSAGGLTLSAEYRDYEKFAHEFHDPPTSLKQHTWTLLNRVNGVVLSDITNDDVRGYLVEAEYSLDYFKTVRGSFGHAAPAEGTNEFWEVYGEAKSDIGERVSATLAAAESEFLYVSEFEERLSFFGELVTELDDLTSLSFGLEWSEVQSQNQLTAAFTKPHEFTERIISVSYGRSPWLNLSTTFETTTDDTEEDDNWATIQAEIVLNESQDLTVSWGRERAGWKCSGGVCFFEPEFEGLKVRWVARY